MNEEIWSILGTVPTDNKEQLKSAYRQKLAAANPEEHPEGFKRLRKAYEEALALASSPKEGPPPSRLWMEQVRAVYGTLSRRIDPGQWYLLLKEEFCVNPDTGIEARNALLSFLYEHYRIPNEIWRILDEEFQLREERDALYRLFPQDYIDFILSQLSMPSWFDYTLFEGPDQADYDGFLELYMGIRKDLAAGNKEAAREGLSQAEGLGIRHPWLAVEQARLLLLSGEQEKALSLLRSLFSSYPQCGWILYSLAEAEWDGGDRENARLYFEQVLQKEPYNYNALVILAQYYREKEEPQRAKAYLMTALTLQEGNPELLAALDHVNSRLIPFYEKQCGARPKDLSSKMELARCYLQSRLWEKGLSLLESFRPDTGSQKEYLLLKADLLFGAGRLSEAAGCARLGISTADAAKTDSGEPQDGVLWDLLCRIYRKMSLCVKKEQKKSLLLKALEAAGAALKTGRTTQRLLRRAGLYLETGRYSDCVEEVNRLPQNGAFYLPALLLRQKAFYYMDSFEDVMGDFYRITEICPDCPDAYVRSMKMLYDRRRFMEEEELVEKAAKYGVSAPEYELERLRLKRHLAGSPAEEAEVIEELRLLEADCVKSQKPASLTADVIHEQVRGLMNINRYARALKDTDRALSLEADSPELLRTKAGILTELKRYGKALEVYERCLEQNPDSAFLQEKTGLCYMKTGQPEKALACFEKTRELSPGHPRVNSHIAGYYFDLLKKTEDLVWLKKALPYAKRQLKRDPRSFYYAEMGLLYMEAGIWDRALKYFQAGIRANPNNVYVYNNAGCVYKYTGRFEEAIRMFETAVSLLIENESPLPYDNLGDCYERMGEYENALDAYLKNLKLFPKSVEIRQHIAGVLVRMKRFEEALSYLEKVRSMARANQSLAWTDLGRLYAQMGEKEKAVACFTQGMEAKDRKDGRAARELGHFYQAAGEYGKALACYETARQAKDAYEYDCLQSEKIYAGMGEPEKARQWFEHAMDYIREIRGSVENYVTSLYQTPKRLCLVGDLYFYLGDKETAQAFYRRVPAAGTCRACTARECLKYRGAMERQSCKTEEEEV